jgi:hypothetical protein
VKTIVYTLCTYSVIVNLAREDKVDSIYKDIPRLEAIILPFQRYSCGHHIKGRPST